MRKKIVAGNWKMNLTLDEAILLATSVSGKLKGNQEEVQVVLIPSFPFITEIKKKLDPTSHLYIGAQNCHANNKGAFTGEVSASMLSSIGCEYVLVGHSERRLYFNETNDELVKKIKEALTHKLKVIFCVGETLEERKTNTHFATIKNQLQDVLSHVNEQEFKNIIIAYEPVWAIGTGETATTEQAQEMHGFIRKIVSEIYNIEISEQTSLLYGGSCNAQNAQSLFACKDVDGGLIGGAALKADDFCTIVKSFS